MGHITKTDLGADLIRLRDAFVSRESGARFLGYLVAQKLKMKGERAHTVNRPELIEKYGYDTKFAMHALRLGYEGIEMMAHGRLDAARGRAQSLASRAVRSGQVDEAGALALIEDAEARLRTLVDGCKLETNIAAINKFMVLAHASHWSASHLWKSTKYRFGGSQ